VDFVEFQCPGLALILRVANPGQQHEENSGANACDQSSVHFGNYIRSGRARKSKSARMKRDSGRFVGKRFSPAQSRKDERHGVYTFPERAAVYIQFAKIGEAGVSERFCAEGDRLRYFLYADLQAEAPIKGASQPVVFRFGALQCLISLRRAPVGFADGTAATPCRGAASAYCFDIRTPRASRTEQLSAPERHRYVRVLDWKVSRESGKAVSAGAVFACKCKQTGGFRLFSKVVNV
jgi:hypothetical protein